MLNRGKIHKYYDCKTIFNFQNKFTLYAKECQRFLGNIECGGGHRSFDTKICYSNSKPCLQFLFCKAGKAYISNIDLKAETEISVNFKHND